MPVCVIARPLSWVLLMGGSSWLIARYRLLGMIVSILASLAALILVHRLATEILGDTIARRTVVYLLAFPTGFYLVAAYNESLFVAVIVTTCAALGTGVFCGWALADGAADPFC